jgi:uncharacterized protein
MLELRPTCEHGNAALPSDSLEARICSCECTFCSACAETIFGNVCQNCGGGFVPRPIRPATNWKGDHFLGAYPAGTIVKHRPVDSHPHYSRRHLLQPRRRCSGGHARHSVGQQTVSSMSFSFAAVLARLRTRLRGFVTNPREYCGLKAYARFAERLNAVTPEKR